MMQRVLGDFGVGGVGGDWIQGATDGDREGRRVARTAALYYSTCRGGGSGSGASCMHLKRRVSSESAFWYAEHAFGSTCVER